jgi:hypothetical protein
MSKTNQSQTSRREFLTYSSVAIVAGFLGYGLRAEAETMHRMSGVDEPNVHNMLIVGQETVFLSHLPMFSAPDFASPHRYQAILEATFTKVGGNPQAVYANDRKSHPATKIYTLNPDEFVLPKLLSTNASAPVSSFGANVFRGHLEKPGHRVLLREITVSIKNVLHFREFEPEATRPAQLEYILFGKGKELFLAHFITRPPDFDQVLAVSAADHSFTDDELGKGLHVVLARPNAIAQRLTEKQEAVGEVRAANGTASPLQVRFKAGAEFYFEEGELRVPAVFTQTSAERKAGFP